MSLAQKFAETMNINIRSGVHIGSVYSGIVGNILPHFSPFGINVIIAARLEATSIPQCTHISKDVYDRLSTRDDYNITSNGKPLLKGIDEQFETFYVRNK